MAKPAVLGQIRKQAADILARAGIDSPGREADILLSDILGVPDAFILSHPEYILTAADTEIISKAISNRAKRIPLAYITGHACFYGLDYKIDQGVLVPRPDSEILVETAIRWLENPSHRQNEKLSVLDLCTGSGCIGLSIAVHIRKSSQEIKLTLTDIDSRAVNCARKNIHNHDFSVAAEVLQADLFPERPGKYDLITANPPYIPDDCISGLMPEVSCYEPRAALDGGKDGLDFYRKIMAEAHNWLNPGGAVFLEHGFDQGTSVNDIIRKNGRFIAFPAIYDYGGNPRVSGGCLI